MKRFTFMDGLPVRGSEAQLVTAAIAAYSPQSLSELARDAGISKFSASRAAEGLLASGILVQDAQGYSFNDAHPEAKVLIDLAWRFSGVRRRYDPWGQRDDYDSSHWHYGKWVPQSLGPTADLAGGGPGPDLRAARETVAWMGQLYVRLREYESVAGDVYSRWHTERLRDVIHQTLHFGAALSRARTLLSAAADHETQGAADPQDVCVPGRVWARATYLVAAELRDLVRVIHILDTALYVGHEVNRQRTDACFHLEQINTAGRENEFTEVSLDHALEAAAAASALWLDESYGQYKAIGGTPGPADVGTAGDRILAVQMYRDAQTVAERVQEMAAHPCLERWRAEHPEEAEQFRLADRVPEHLLSDTPALAKRGLPTPGGGNVRPA